MGNCNSVYYDTQRRDAAPTANADDSVLNVHLLYDFWNSVGDLLHVFLINLNYQALS